MTREEAYEYWRYKYEAARNFDDPHWEGGERRDFLLYVDALATIVKMLEPPACNADHIRSMTDKELAELFAPTGNGLKACPDGAKYPKSCEDGCGNCWLRWLKSPVEVDDG